ncbi:MAG: hypothetical protein ABIG40_01755 [Parcubacteria group bacterium]
MPYEDQMLDPFITDGDEETPEIDTEVTKSDEDETEEFSDADL